MSNSKSPIDQLREMVAIQGADGNLDYDDYMVGMFNGMELALAVMEDREPQFRTLKQAQPATCSTAKPALAGLCASPDLKQSSHQVAAVFGSAELVRR